MEKEELSCIDCYKTTCENQNMPYPDFCETVKYKELADEAVELLKSEENNLIAKSAAEIEGNFYCKLTRVEETVLFAKKIGSQKSRYCYMCGHNKRSKNICQNTS